MSAVCLDLEIGTEAVERQNDSLFKKKSAVYPPGLVKLSHFDYSCLLHIQSGLVGKKFNLLGINYLQVHLVFLVFMFVE